MSTNQEKFEAIKFSVDKMKDELEKIEDQISDDDHSVQYKPHLVMKRSKLIEAIAAGEKLLESFK